MNEPPDHDSRHTQPVTLREAFWVWCRVAVMSFGGPAGQIAVMHRIIVEEKKWLDEQRFLHALNYCMLLPGPEAQQLAIYIGWLMHRVRGGLLAGILFVLPGFVSILALSTAYAYWRDADFLRAVFFGLKPAVMAIVIEAVLRIGKRVLKNRVLVTIAAASFCAIFFFNLPFPLLIVSAAAIGLLGGKWLPSYFVLAQKGNDADQRSNATLLDHRVSSVYTSLWRSVMVSIVCLGLWSLPLVAVRMWLGEDSAIYQEGIFFSKAAVVTFGGAYSVLAYVAQQAVDTFHWLEPGEMLDGLGMAETTPGPLIMVVQFVAFMGAFRQPGDLSPFAAAIVGSMLTTWVTFAPCFYWIFLGAPYVERLRGNRVLSSALTAITSAVVGVVLNLGVWFSLHTLFSTVESQSLLGMRLLVPRFDSIQLGSLAIAVLAFLLTFRWKKGMATTLGISVLAGIILWSSRHLFVL